MDGIHADKEYWESGSIDVLTEDGEGQYEGALTAFSGHGNSTWKEEKKPYSFTLKESRALCGMSEGKSWKLLALYYEHDKVHSKLTYDLARELGLSMTPDCTWVDLYCNGEYQGLYLLTEGKKRNIPDTAAWLLEKTHKSRLTEEEEATEAFCTEEGYWFQGEKLRDGAAEDLEEVQAYIQQIEDLILAGDRAYRDYLDLDSLARKFLLEKIVMNYDAMGCSAYFVLGTDGRLSAGPAWDYDNSFGTSGFFDYTSPIEEAPDEMWAWFNVLYEDEEFYDCMTAAYEELLPSLAELLETGIDEAAEQVEASVSLDLSRWGMARNKMYIYEDYDAYLRYLKYFLANRLNYLNTLWGIEGWEFAEPESTGELHDVTFCAETGEVLEKLQVPDGTRLEDLPDLDEELYSGWYFEGGEKEYASYFPVYGDLTLYAKTLEGEEDE